MQMIISLCIFGSLLSINVFCCYALELDGIYPPSAEIFLLDRKTQTFKIHSSNSSSDITVDEGETILIRCRSLEKSVQIIYSGYGVPILSTNTSVIDNENNGTQTYTAALQIADVREDYSGEYKCIYSESPDIFSFFHIFIPGKRVFTIKKGREILFSVSDTEVKIPCPVSSKNATVELKRAEKGVMEDVLNSTVASYDPRRGFTFHLNSLFKSKFDSKEDFGDNIQGTYICSTSNEEELLTMEFTLTKSRKGQTSEALLSKTGSTERPINPCKSFRCSPHEECKVYNGRPKCVCKPFRRGFDCALGCVNDSDCLKHQKCSKVHECVNRCEGYVCGKNAECQTDDEGNATCICKSGYSRNSSSLDCNSIAIVSKDLTKNYCNPSRCGPYGKCQLKGGKNVCVCMTGAVGTPPNCHMGCGADPDCPWDKKCSPLGECINVCKEKVCGEKALCRTLRRDPVCYCPIGYSGDPSIACYSSTP